MILFITYPYRFSLLVEKKILAKKETIIDSSLNIIKNIAMKKDRLLGSIVDQEYCQ